MRRLLFLIALLGLGAGGLWAWEREVGTGAAVEPHVHTATDITSGILAAARGGTGGSFTGTGAIVRTTSPTLVSAFVDIADQALTGDGERTITLNHADYGSVTFVAESDSTIAGFILADQDGTEMLWMHGDGSSWGFYDPDTADWVVKFEGDSLAVGSIPVARLSGVVPEASGGTGSNLVFTNGDILLVQGDSLAVLAKGTENQWLQMGAALPAWADGPTGSGTVTSVASGTGLTGGPITTSGTLALTGDALELHNLGPANDGDVIAYFSSAWTVRDSTTFKADIFAQDANALLDTLVAADFDGIGKFMRASEPALEGFMDINIQELRGGGARTLELFDAADSDSSMVAVFTSATTGGAAVRGRQSDDSHAFYLWGDGTKVGFKNNAGTEKVTWDDGALDTGTVPSTQVTGDITPAQGGTGASLTPGQGDLYMGTSGAIMAVLSPASTSGYVLSSTGASSDLSWISVGGTGTVTQLNTANSSGTSGGPITTTGTVSLYGNALKIHQQTGGGILNLDSLYLGTGSPTISTKVAFDASDIVHEDEQPEWHIYEQSGPANEKWWTWQADAGALRLITINDAGTEGDTVFTIDRTGVVNTYTGLDAPTYIGGNSPTGAEALVVQGSIRHEAAAPAIATYESDAGTNEKLSVIQPAAGVLKFQFPTDAGASAVSWLEVDRTGTTPGPTSFPQAPVYIGSATPTATSDFVLTGDKRQEDGSPESRLYESDAVANEKLWSTIADGGKLVLQAINDAGTAFDSVLVVDRTGAANTYVRLDSPLRVGIASPVGGGDLIVGGTIRQEHAGPAQALYESDAAANEKLWSMAPAAGVLSFVTNTDVGGAGTTWLEVDRSTTSITSVSIPNGYFDVGGLTPVASDIMQVAGNIRATSTAPGFYLYESDEGTNHKLWGARASAQKFSLQSLYDNGTVAPNSNFLSAARSNYGVDSVGVQMTDLFRINADGLALGDGTHDINGYEPSAGQVITVRHPGAIVEEYADASDAISDASGIRLDITMAGTANNVVSLRSIIAEGTSENGAHIDQYVYSGGIATNHRFEADGDVVFGSNNANGHDFRIVNGASYSELDAGESSFTTSSSRKLKKNIREIPYQIRAGVRKVLDRTPVYNFRWKEGDDPRQQVGMMAEEFVKIGKLIAPEKASDETYSAHQAIMALWLHAQEVSAENRRLRKDLGEMETRLEALERKVGGMGFIDVPMIPPEGCVELDNGGWLCGN